MIPADIRETVTGIAAIVGQHKVRTSEPMKFHTSFKAGGPADIMVSPEDTASLCKAVVFCRRHEIPCIVMGNGTNLLVRDGGIRGVVVKTSDCLKSCVVHKEGILEAQAGIRLSKIAVVACHSGLAGLEFASGIPGTLGGAVVMNAGAYGREMKDVVTETVCLDEKGNTITLKGNQHGFGYRSSYIQDSGYIVLKSFISLQKGDGRDIASLMKELNCRRKDRQPLEMPSAGSIFKRPVGHYAGKLIQDCGLRGLTVGGAQVSDKHCGFIINRGGATASDIIELMEQITSEVEDRYGVRLEPEIRIVGEDKR